MAKENTETLALMYRGKPLVRRGGFILYGDLRKDVIIEMMIENTTKANDMEIANDILIQLRTNHKTGKEKVLKKAERDGFCRAFDLATFWLEEALGEQ